MVSAAFVHDGFLVRLRAGVEDFVAESADDWDVVLFTAANRAIYEGLMAALDVHLKALTGREPDAPALWRRILFRDDCAYDFDSAGRLYHHKDLTKFGRDLAHVVIVDNSALAFKSLEPNAVLIANFYGRDDGDAELDKVLDITQGLIDELREHEEGDGHFVDFRYLLSGVEPHCHADLDCFDRRNPEHILQSTHRFLNDLKLSLMDKGRLSTELQFGEPKALPLDELAALLKLEEDEEVAQLTQTLSTLAASRTSMAFGDEGLATPSGHNEAADEFDAKDESEDEEASKTRTREVSQSATQRSRTSSYSTIPSAAIYESMCMSKKCQTKSGSSSLLPAPPSTSRLQVPETGFHRSRAWACFRTTR